MIGSVKEDCYWHYEEPYMGSSLDFCKIKNKTCDCLSPIEPSDCMNCEDYHNRYKPTKADRIRSKTDEELAKFFKMIAPETKVAIGMKEVTWLEWLRSEEEGDFRT